jgi:hypothetical protein
MVLVPAFMHVLGRANWWAPRPLVRLHQRIGLSETAGYGRHAAAAPQNHNGVVPSATAGYGRHAAAAPQGHNGVVPSATARGQSVPSLSS